MPPLLVRKPLALSFFYSRCYVFLFFSFPSPHSLGRSFSVKWASSQNVLSTFWHAAFMIIIIRSQTNKAKLVKWQYNVISIGMIRMKWRMCVCARRKKAKQTNKTIIKCIQSKSNESNKDYTHARLEDIRRKHGKRKRNRDFKRWNNIADIRTRAGAHSSQTQQVVFAFLIFIKKIIKKRQIQAVSGYCCCHNANKNSTLFIFTK